ncbi:MAG TPA: proton-conducting transporter membrane subunit [Candidatus Omnitrophota bacterium]|nr:proton-conducting transporter membrane subunit [Candidatus Omnitrophota bacterium]HPD84244.1 proton-conducting transporter membrane subunit [Candidatus Omnitrophota bacterium]HRZ03100.1 proton-conducting transporter membrane subunit [Candidatus Omnitrophota bacterium]
MPGLFLFDPLSIFFIFVIAIVSLPSAVYSVGYLKGGGSRFATTLSWILLCLFVASMGLVVTVNNVIAFLVAWEIMSLVSYFLVIADAKHERSVQAGTIYIIMTHIGTAFLVAAFMIMAKYAGSFNFAAIKSACLVMPPQIKNIIFLLLLVGFGTKAGIVPLHIWLPYAHPQAPSHISSIMSGVMIKTAIYGIIRFVIYLLSADTAWWGILILILAIISCLVGVIYALMEHDLKRLLAYHSVENIGIILLGVGLSMFFLSIHLPYLAVFSLIAGLYHLVNHAIFKGLLFLCAGSVYKATGTRDIEKLGGLIKKMPQTAVCFLLGAMAISALPPLNGFVSEWLTLQAFFLGAFKVTGVSRLFLGVCAALLALTGGLAAACFVKAFGITFLAQSRSRHAEEAKEVSLSMKVGMYFLSFLTVAFGLAAVPVMRLLAKVAGTATDVDTKGVIFSLNNFIVNPLAEKGIYLSPLWLALVLLILGAIAFALFLLPGRRKAVSYSTWDCGYYQLDARNEYTATAFSKPFRIAFSFFLLPYRRTQKIRESFYHVKSFVYETHTTPVFRKYGYAPVLALVFGIAKSMRRIQPGSIHLYLSYIFVTVILLILFMGRFH